MQTHASHEDVTRDGVVLILYYVCAVCFVTVIYLYNLFAQSIIKLCSFNQTAGIGHSFPNRRSYFQNISSLCLSFIFPPRLFEHRYKRWSYNYVSKHLINKQLPLKRGTILSCLVSKLSTPLLVTCQLKYVLVETITRK